MLMSDTSPEAREVLLQLLRKQSPATRIQQVFDAIRTGRLLAMAGLRLTRPHLTEEQLWHVWARQHLGSELYEEVYGKRPA